MSNADHPILKHLTMIYPYDNLITNPSEAKKV